MCGIAGLVDLTGRTPVDAEQLRRMNDRLARRGPDDAGYLAEGEVGLGMRRLSIIDLATGQQPIHNEDKSVSIVFNGEIYNYPELRADLLDRGHRFTTTSDTEVIVHLYEEHGEDCVDYLRGMFAFALWDRPRETLLLARDRLGIKPLYYAQTPHAFVFASELKAIAEHPDVPRRLSAPALHAYLRFGYVPEPLCILDGVARLAPGHTLTIRGRRVGTPRRYWRSTDAFRTPVVVADEASAAAALWRHLQAAVRSHLVSDVPVGAFLSGGVDSSAVVALMTEAAGAPVKTFAVGFRESGWDELPYARRVARFLGTEHHELVVEPRDLKVLEDVLAAVDEPLADASAIPTYLVSRLARQHVKVVLSGDGGDEIFAGYERYLVDQRRLRLGSLPGVRTLLRAGSAVLPQGTPGKNHLYNLSLPRFEAYLDSVSMFPARAMAQMLEAPLATAACPLVEALAESQGLDPLSRLQDLDLNSYLPGDILTKVDRMSMAASLEARVPLLDHPLVEFACALPPRLRLEAGETKRLLKRALKGRVPDEVLTRRKQGFGVPLPIWLGDRLPGFFADNLAGGERLAGLGVKRRTVQALLHGFARLRRSDQCHRLWALVVLDRAMSRLGVTAVTG